jgi:molecular chaperone DnaK
VSQDDRQAIETAAAELRAALQSEDASLIKTGMDALTKAAYHLAEEVYKGGSSHPQPDGSSSNGGAGARGGGHGDGPDGSREAAEDVDYEVVDDGKKKK